MPSTTYPGADLSQDRSKFSGITMPGIDKLLLHTTESAGWPSYPDFAPQLTVDPIRKLVRQHMPLNRSASTLADPSSTAVRENRDNVLQVEIVGYCDPARAGSAYHVDKWGPEEYAWLALLVRWVHLEWGVPLVSPLKWPAYPASYGNAQGQRLTSSEYDAYRGVLGHMHAPGNDHGDPGNIDVELLLRYAAGTQDPPATIPDASTAEKLELPTKLAPYAVTMPVASGEVGYAFGTPDKGYRAGFHTGQDYKCAQGTAALAVWSGTWQRQASDPRGYGTWGILQADNGRDYVYCHLSAHVAKDGERVVQGQTVAKTGSTGNSTGPHLHLEDRPRGGAYGAVRRPTWPTWDGQSLIFAAVEGVSHPLTTLLGYRLMAHLGPSIYRVGPGPTRGPADTAACKRFQLAQGWSGHDADGVEGPETWRRLMLPGPFELTEDAPSTSAPPGTPEPEPIPEPEPPAETWPKVTKDKPAADYYVDGAKVAKVLNGRTKAGTVAKRREPGFHISTADAIVIGGATDPSSSGTTRWVRTEAGYYYALEFLTTTAPPKPNGLVIHAGTWNPYVGNSLANMKAGLKAFIDAGADVVTFQELSTDSKQKGLTRYAKSLGWAATKRNSAVTIFYNAAKHSLVRETYTLVEKGGRKWESGAGGNDSIYKIIMELTLKDRATGREWVALNHHLVPTVEKSGRFRSGKPVRVSIYKRQIATAKARLNSYGAGGRPVIIGADWNVGWGDGSASDWVEDQLDAAGATVCWDEAKDQATHTSGRCIDWLAGKGCQPTKTRRMERHGSDHYGVLVTFES